MTLAFNVLILLVASAPVFGSIGRPVMLPMLMLLIAVGAAAVGFSSRQADVNHLALATTRVRWIALAVGLVLLQLAPLPLRWSHPMWTSAAEVLPLSLGHITIDIGRTVQAFIASLAWLVAVTVSTVVTRDRRRAELALLAAAAVASILSFAVLIQRLTPSGSSWIISREVALCFGMFGILLDVAVLLLAFERRETRRTEASRYMPIGLCGLAAIGINALALTQIAIVSQWVAVGVGIAILLLLLVIRRLALSRWTIAALCLATSIGAAILAAWLFDRNPAASGLLRFITPVATESMITLQRLIADSRWFGSGANTFDVLARIYQSDTGGDALRAHTAAIQLAVETGWIGLLIFAASSLAMFVQLFRGALSRGRDWFFPAMAASIIATCLCSSFVTEGLFNPSVALTLAALTGVGLAQGYSQARQS